ncbi:MAG: HAD family hydrolase [Candidatus Cloacimonas sp. SDB]|nr:MAG: HAD family hydrolase [Candidatus Cloacimonas sp. SDB]
MQFKAVIFDLDGTLIDSMGIWYEVDKQYLLKRGIHVPDNLFDEIEGGNSFIEIAQFFKQRFELPDSIEEIMDEWTEMVEEYYRNRISLRPGVAKLLNLLKQHQIKLGIGTSNSMKLTKLVLSVNGVLDNFDHIVAGCEAIKGKPFPDIFLSVAEVLRVKPKECLVIEDVLVGVQAAKNAGMGVYAVYDEYSKDKFAQIQETADFFAQDFSQLEEKIKEDLALQ